MFFGLEDHIPRKEERAAREDIQVTESLEATDIANAASEIKETKLIGKYVKIKDDDQ